MCIVPCRLESSIASAAVTRWKLTVTCTVMEIVFPRVALALVQTLCSAALIPNTSLLEKAHHGVTTWGNMMGPTQSLP